MKTFSNTCIRCGKERIFSKRWNEYIGTSLVTYTTNICPDPECQKIVETRLKDRKNHLDAIQANSLKRRAENRKNRKYLKKTFRHRN